MKKTAWIIFLYLTVAAPLIGKEWIAQVVDLTINAKFDRAERLCFERLSDADSSLQAYFYLSSVLNSKMTHFEDDRDRDRFLAVIDTIVHRTTHRLNGRDVERNTRARLLFYRGSALGYRAFYSGKTGSYFSALKDGLKSIDDLKRAVELDSTLYDAYLGIGVYQYWRSTKLRFLLWTPFVDDLRLTGIENIQKAIDHSRHSRYMAMHQLIYILLNEKQFDRALGYAEEAVRKYPDSPFMRWAYAHALYKMHRNRAALKAYRAILNMIQSGSDSNQWHEVTCRVRMAEIYRRLKDWANCRGQLKVVLAFNPQQLPAVEQKEYRKARKLMRQCAVRE